MLRGTTDLIQRLREHRISAPPEHPVHSSICDEAADEIERLRTASKSIAAADFGRVFDNILLWRSGHV